MRPSPRPYTFGPRPTWAPDAYLPLARDADARDAAHGHPSFGPLACQPARVCPAWILAVRAIGRSSAQIGGTKPPHAPAPAETLAHSVLSLPRSPLFAAAAIRVRDQATAAVRRRQRRTPLRRATPASLPSSFLSIPFAGASRRG